MRRSTKGLILMIVYWILASIVMFYIAGVVLATSDNRPDNTFDDCHGSNNPNDKGYGCTHGGLPEHERM